jgi:hypothetical protein
MVRRRAWMTLVFTPILCGAAITACGVANTMPPNLNEPIEGGFGGGGGGGGGGGTGVNACVKQGGMCLMMGDLGDGGGGVSSCPVYLAGVSCGPGSITEAGLPVLICCTGFNDAGQPTVDAGPG